MKTNIEIEDTITEQTTIQACLKYREECDSATKRLMDVFEQALEAGWDRDDLIILGVEQGGLAESTVRKLVSTAAVKKNRRLRAPAVRLAPEVREFIAYICKFRNGHKPSRKELRSWCLAASRQFKKASHFLWCDTISPVTEARPIRMDLSGALSVPCTEQTREAPAE